MNRVLAVENHVKRKNIHAWNLTMPLTILFFIEIQMNLSLFAVPFVDCIRDYGIVLLHF